MEDYEWTDDDFNVTQQNSTLQPGCIGRKKPSWSSFTSILQFFHLFWKESIWETIVFKTNEKAQSFGNVLYHHIQCKLI